jgi:signal peptidase II
MRKSGLIWLWIAAIVILIDHLSKVWVTTHLMFYEPVEVLPIFDFTLAYNTGAAFSFLQNASGWQNIFFTSLALIVSGIVVIWLAKTPVRERWFNIGLCFILGGALGNAWDRLLYGYVIDFLSFHYGTWHFAIFNLADSAIFVGACMLLWNWFRVGAKQTG